MNSYDIRMLDDVDNINDLKRYMNMFIIFSGGAVNDFGGDGRGSTFIKENPDIFNEVVSKPDVVKSPIEYKLHYKPDSAFKVIRKNIQRLFG